MSKRFELKRSERNMNFEIASYDLNFLVRDVEKAAKEGKAVTMKTEWSGQLDDDILVVEIEG